ncbi:MAG TPA: winged helix-turn-helix transcriptional regulator [Candidatus Cryptobacteroides sp.]|nr:winged helix-turn-helix transcriptional regulator [Candidatus Cryptobacteroides sp.]
MEKINEIIQASASLEGCTLNTAEYALLLNEGISSAGKTIDEQLLCLDLLNGYKKCYSFAQAREFWSVFRIKSIAEVALRHSPASGLDIKEERIVQKVCDLANTQRLHIHEHRAEEMYRTSFEIHYLISLSRPWAYGNDFIGRLLMNYLQYECRLEPTIIRPSQRAEYKRLLKVATREEISEIFVSYMMEHRCDAPEPESLVKKQDIVAPAAALTKATPILPSVGTTASVSSADKFADTATTVFPSNSAESNTTSASSSSAKTNPATTSIDKKQKVASNSPKTAKPSSRELILALLRDHPYMSARDLAERIGISPKGVEKNLRILKENGSLRRVGPDKGGKWEVLTINF